MGEAPNQPQAERWNGDSGRHWIAHRERHVAIRAGLTPHLLRAAAVAPGERVLDVGCGCGEVAIEVARAGGEVTGLDLSEPMLAVARRLAGGAGVGGVRFVRGDAQVLALPAGHYDVVMSGFGVMFFDDPAAAFANLRRALRPGGRLVFLCWRGEEHNELFGIPLRAFGAGPSQDPFADPEWIGQMLGGAGFAEVTAAALDEPARLGTDVADVRDYLLSMGRFRRLVAEVDDPQRTGHAVSTMERELAARQRADGVWVRAAAWLVGARARPEIG